MRKPSTIKYEIKQIKKYINELESSVKTDPEVIKAKKAFENAIKKVEAAIVPHLDEAFKVLEKLQKELKAHNDSTNTLTKKYLENKELGLGELVNRFDARTKKVVWESPTNRFIIFTMGGSVFWSGIGYKSYAKAATYLLDLSLIKEETTKGITNLAVGFAPKGDTSEGGLEWEHEGRLNKETKEKMIKKALELENE
jgi:hypothetical protein